VATEMLLHQVRPLASHPRHDEVEATTAADGPNPRPPPGLIADEVAETEECADLIVGRVFEQAQGCPVTVETSERHATGQERAKLLLAHEEGHTLGTPLLPGLFPCPRGSLSLRPDPTGLDLVGR